MFDELDADPTPPSHGRALRIAGRVVVAAGACWIFGSCFLEAFALKPVSRATERVGQYEIRSETYDGFGHPTVHKDLYAGKGERAILVAERVGSYFVGPGDSSRVIYEWCGEPPGAPCGAFLFEASTLRPRQLTRIHPLQHFGLQTPWSPDGRSAAFLEQRGGVVLNLKTGAVIDVASELRLDGRLRVIDRAEWTSKGALTVRVRSHLVSLGPGRTTTTVYLLDPETGEATVRKKG
ncbi:MAG: hypothetical protein ACJ8AO_03515 [Gemmatimonadaceae bacterium]